MNKTTCCIILMIAVSFLLVNCGSDNRSNQPSINIEPKSNPSSPKAITNASPDPIRTVRIKTLADLEKSDFFRSYQLYKIDGWELNTGAYNNSYKTPSLPSTAFEVQTKGDEVIGLGIVFYETDQLKDSELSFVYNLLQAIDTRIKLNSNIRDYIKANAERSVFQVKQSIPITFGSFKIYAGKVGPEQTISIEKF